MPYARLESLLGRSVFVGSLLAFLAERLQPQAIVLLSLIYFGVLVLNDLALWVKKVIARGRSR